MVCRPVTQFCCGCSLSVGIWLLLVLHFGFNLFEVIKTAGMLCYPEYWGQMPLDGIGLQVALAGFCLAGLPIILTAALGLLKRNGVLIRLYLIYALTCFALDMAYAVKEFIWSAPCEDMPSVLADAGKAWSCGVLRSANATIFILITFIQAYMLFVVYSYAEDLAATGRADLADLAKGMSDEAIRKRRHKGEMRAFNKGMAASSVNGAVGDILGVAGLDEGGESAFADPYGGGGYGQENGFGNGDFGSLYGTVGAGLGDSTRFFRGRYHEMQYPPPARHF